MRILVILIASMCFVNGAHSQSKSKLPSCVGSYNAKTWTNCYGTRTYSNGDTYVGEWKDGKFSGIGTYNFLDGAKYVGDWKNDKRNGQGTGTWTNGVKYVGEYKDDIISGQGVFTWPDGSKYIGEFKNSKKNGQGTYTWPNGYKYVGEWKEGQMDGQGAKYSASGEILESGLWRNNKLIHAEDKAQQAENIRIQILEQDQKEKEKLERAVEAGKDNHLADSNKSLKTQPPIFSKRVKFVADCAVTFKLISAMIKDQSSIDALLIQGTGYLIAAQKWDQIDSKRNSPNVVRDYYSKSVEERSGLILAALKKLEESQALSFAEAFLREQDECMKFEMINPELHAYIEHAEKTLK